MICTICSAQIPDRDANRNSPMVGSRIVVKKYCKDCAKARAQKSDKARAAKRVTLQYLAFGSRAV